MLHRGVLVWMLFRRGLHEAQGRRFTNTHLRSRGPRAKACPWGVWTGHSARFCTALPLLGMGKSCWEQRGQREPPNCSKPDPSARRRAPAVLVCAVRCLFLFSHLVPVATSFPNPSLRSSSPCEHGTQWPLLHQQHCGTGCFSPCSPFCFLCHSRSS